MADFVASGYAETKPERFNGEKLFNRILDEPYEHIGKTAVKIQYKVRRGGDGVASWKAFISVPMKRTDRNFKHLDCIQFTDGIRDIILNRRDMIMIEIDTDWEYKRNELDKVISTMGSTIGEVLGKVRAIEAKLEALGS